MYAGVHPLLGHLKMEASVFAHSAAVSFEASTAHNSSLQSWEWSRNRRKIFQQKRAKGEISSSKSSPVSPVPEKDRLQPQQQNVLRQPRGVGVKSLIPTRFAVELLQLDW